MSVPSTVSVIVPTYNRARLISRGIRSALANLLPGDEIIVADDASTDDTESVVRSFGDPVRYVRGSHGGAGAARNLGLTLATKDLVAFLDSDDEWFPDKLALQRTYLDRRPDVLFAFSNFRSKLDTGEEEPNFLAHWHKDSRSWNEILADGLPYSRTAPLPDGRPDFMVHVGDMFLAEMLSDYMATSTVITRRVEAGDALRFSDDLRISEDKECFGRLAQRGAGAYFDCETSIQWGHSGPRVSDTNAYALASARLTLFDRIWCQDATFMARHGETLAAARQRQHLKRARWLLQHGRASEARRDLEQAGSLSPFSLRLLATLPDQLLGLLLTARRALKR